MNKSIFISHRHDDHKIATVFSRHFQMWNMHQDEIFQSSDYKTSTIIGEPLRPQLKQALSEARLVLLIYTTSDADWEFCVWECGVATNPTDDTPTRVACFQVGNQKSRVFEGETVFKLTRDDIGKFVEQFHRHVGFFREGEAYQPDVSSEILAERTEHLWNDLRPFAPEGPEEERSRWDRFTLRIQSTVVQELKDCLKDTDADGAQGKAFDLLRRNATVIDSFGKALQHFGYDVGRPDLTLDDLVERWRDEIASETDPQGWIHALCQEMWRSIEDRPAQPSWELMKSIQFSDWWLFPVLNRVRLTPDSFEFDVSLYRFPGSLPGSLAVVRERRMQSS